MEGGTGVFYQVMPAVGPDGKNVMKLIPVQKVNGQFIPMQTTSSKTDGLGAQTVIPQPVRIMPPSVSHNKIPVVEPTVDGQFILKGPTNTNIRLIKSQQPVNSPKVLVGKVRLPIITPKTTQSLVSLPVNISGSAVACPNITQLPVTVSSPRLPSGHYLQIPPDAKVQTLPASALPQSIKKRILNLPYDTASTEKPSTVVYVSPVNSMKIVTSQLKDSAPPMTQNISPTVGVSNKEGSTYSLSGLVQSPTLSASDSVMKWVVQQGDGSSSPCLVPASPTCMTSEILKAVAHMEKKISLTSNLSSSQESQKMISPSKDNALVMCNGKVYFVTKRDSGLCVSASHATAKEGSSSRKPTESPSSSSGSHKSVTKQDPQPICIGDDSDEIIDLCDDDPQTYGTSGTGVKDRAGVTTTEEEDDSNVIFVSYIPPQTSVKSNAKDASSVTGGVQSDEPMLVQNNSELTKQISSEHENCASGKQTETCQDMINAEPVSEIQTRVDLTTEEQRLDEQELASQNGQSLEDEEVHLQACLSTVTEDSTDNVQAQNNTAPEARTDSGLDGELAPAGMESNCRQGIKVIKKGPSDIEDAAQNTENTSQDTSEVQSLIVPVTNISIKKVDRPSQHEWDCKMRQLQLFGITKEIRISLKRIHSVKKDTPAETRSINKRTLEGIRRLIQGSQMEIKAKKLIEAQVHLAKDAKRRKVESSRATSANTSQSQGTDQPHVSLEGGLFNSLRSKMNSLTADAGFSTIVPVLNIVPSASVGGEPAIVSADVLEGKVFDADTTNDADRLPSTNADRLAQEESAAGPQVNPGESQSSIAETCSSHISISKQATTSGKSDLQPEEVLKRREEPSQLGVEPSHSACEDGRSTTKVLNEELFSTEAMEPEEIKRCEKIKRLKALLKEKEAALEMIRRKMSM